MTRIIARRSLLKSSVIAGAGVLAAPALIGRASAAAIKLRLSSSQANDPKFANGRVFYDNLAKHLKQTGLGEQIEGGEQGDVEYELTRRDWVATLDGTSE